MNLEKVKAELEKINKQKEKSTSTGGNDLLWKPSPGKQQIRILPNPHSEDWPFVKLAFYYDFGKTWISPASVGDPDPVVEFCNELRQERGDKKTSEMNWKLIKKLNPKNRIYVLMLERGKESDGPKWWGFAPSYYETLLGIVNDPDYGDITDLKNGRDVVVEYIPATSEGAYPDTRILVKPNVSIATDDSSLLEKIKSVKNITEIFKTPTYNELKEALTTYLGNQKQETKQPEPVPTQSADVDSFIDELDALFATPPQGK